MKRTETATIISALRVLAVDIQSEDGVANSAIAEAADRMEELADFENEVKSVLGELDHLAEVWGDEGVFRRCRDRLRKVVGNDYLG